MSDNEMIKLKFPFFKFRMHLIACYLNDSYRSLMLFIGKNINYRIGQKLCKLINIDNMNNQQSGIANYLLNQQTRRCCHGAASRNKNKLRCFNSCG